MKKAFCFKVTSLVIFLCLVCVSFCGCVDTQNWVNEISQTAIKSNVTIHVKSYNTNIFNQEIEYQNYFGSGVIYYKNRNTYYCLTNNHVVYKPEKYQKRSLTVTDCYGNEYDAEVVISDPKYDLAVVTFYTTDKVFAPLSLATQNPKTGQDIAAIGQPMGQINTLTLGKVFNMQHTSLEENILASDVEFKVVYHNAPINSGSSGGALINGNLEIVGINFAILFDEKDDSFRFGCAIPIEKVREFLENNHLLFSN
jgi:serine protease Do